MILVDHVSPERDNAKVHDEEYDAVKREFFSKTTAVTPAVDQRADMPVNGKGDQPRSAMDDAAALDPMRDYMERKKEKKLRKEKKKAAKLATVDVV